jgi:hypothetical protein
MKNKRTVKLLRRRRVLTKNHKPKLISFVMKIDFSQKPSTFNTITPPAAFEHVCYAKKPLHRLRKRFKNVAKRPKFKWTERHSSPLKKFMTQWIEHTYQHKE